MTDNTLTVEALANEIRTIDPNYYAPSQLATQLLRFIERHIADQVAGVSKMMSSTDLCASCVPAGRCMKRQALCIANGTAKTPAPAVAVPLPEPMIASYVHPLLGEMWDRLDLQRHAIAYGDAREAAAVKQSLTTEPAETERATDHADDIAVDRFALALKEKMAAARAKGRGGWDGPTCDAQTLSNMLRDHVVKGDPRDVANFCMMLWNRGEAIQPEPAGSEAVAYTDPENLADGSHPNTWAMYERGDQRRGDIALYTRPSPVSDALANEIIALAKEREDGYKARMHGDVLNHRIADKLVAIAARLTGAQADA